MKKKLLTLLLILLFVFALVSCGKQTKTPGLPQAGKSEDQPSVPSDTEVPKTSESPAVDTPSESETTAPDKGRVIVSDNQVVTDSQQLLTDLDKEIEDLLRELSEMDGVDDSDLNF